MSAATSQQHADAPRQPAHRSHPGPVRIGVGGPVGAGKTQLIERITRAMSREISMAAVTNDIYTIEDAKILAAQGVLPVDRIVGLETGGCRSHPAIVLAIAGYALEAPPAAVTAAYLQSSVISLTQNAVRAIPLGQDAGQRAIASVRGDVRAAVRRIGGLDETDLGAAAPGIEISQMRHERQRARMFMS